VLRLHPLPATPTTTLHCLEHQHGRNGDHAEEDQRQDGARYPGEYPYAPVHDQRARPDQDEPLCGLVPTRAHRARLKWNQATTTTIVANPRSGSNGRASSNTRRAVAEMAASRTTDETNLSESPSRSGLMIGHLGDAWADARPTGQPGASRRRRSRTACGSPRLRPESRAGCGDARRPQWRRGPSRRPRRGRARRGQTQSRQFR